MAIKYLHKKAANRQKAAESHVGQVSLCQARMNSQSPMAKKKREPISRVATRDTRIAGPRSANTSAEASPTAVEKKRFAKPYTAQTIPAPIAAASSRTPTRPAIRSAHAARIGHKYQPKLKFNG